MNEVNQESGEELPSLPIHRSWRNAKIVSAIMFMIAIGGSVLTMPAIEWLNACNCKPVMEAMLPMFRE